MFFATHKSPLRGPLDLVPSDGGAALFYPYYETWYAVGLADNTNCTNYHEYIRLISEIIHFV